MSYTTIPSNPFTVPGSVAGYLDIRKKASANGGVAGPIVTVAVPAYSGSTGGGTTITQLDTPTNLRQTGATASSNTLAWNASANASGYRLRRSGSTVLLPGSATTYTDSGLAASSSSSYEVQAIGSGSYLDSPYSAAITATTSAPAQGGSDTTPPTSPGQPTVSNVTGSSALLKWAASTDNVGVDHYQVIDSTSLQAVASVAGNVTQYQLSGLASGSTYGYYVVAFDAAGNNARSATATVNTTAQSSFQGPKAPADGTPQRLEQDDNFARANGYITQNDGWGGDTNPDNGYSGGSIAYNLSAGGRISYTVETNSFIYGYQQDTNCGIVDVYMDGKLIENFSQQGPKLPQQTYQLQTVIPYGVHTFDFVGRGVMTADFAIIQKK